MTDDDDKTIKPRQPVELWLGPQCEGCFMAASDCDEGQLWCDQPQDNCEECGLGWTRYVIDTKQAKSLTVEEPYRIKFHD